MSALSKLVPLVLFGTAVAAQACGSVKIDDTSYANGGRQYPISGVIEGTVVYQGPLPCSQNGHIIGNAIILVFDRRNPPPPDGLANTAINFGVVAGDALFADEPREPGPTKYCPKDRGVTTIVTKTSAFAIAPMDAGSYVIQSFYDYTGDFLPTFKFRNLPVAGDIAGGAIDTADPYQSIEVNGKTILKSQDANYAPVFVPVDVGIPGEVDPASRRGVPTFTLPPEGYVASNVTVSVGLALPFTRPYFWPAGSEGPATSAAEPNYAPVVTMEQDKAVLAQPNPGDLSTGKFETILGDFQASFTSVQLNYGLPAAEVAAGVDPNDPFHLQIAPIGAGGGILVWHNGTHASYPGGVTADDSVPETSSIPRLWPLVVFAKLKDDPGHVNDPQGLVAQGSDLKEPVVIIQGLTIFEDSLYKMAIAGADIPVEPTAASLYEHVTVLVRPSVLCIDPRHIDRGGTLVTPHLLGLLPKDSTKDANGKPQDNLPTHPLVDPPSLAASHQLQGLLSSTTPFLVGCLPKGRYGINMVYPTGQAWSTPNEIGSCAAKEGSTDFSSDPGSCGTQPRPVLYSQGTRAVIEIGDPKDPSVCDKNPVPSVCTTLLPE